MTGVTREKTRWTNQQRAIPGVHIYMHGEPCRHTHTPHMHSPYGGSYMYMYMYMYIYKAWSTLCHRVGLARPLRQEMFLAKRQSVTFPPDVLARVTTVTAASSITAMTRHVVSRHVLRHQQQQIVSGTKVEKHVEGLPRSRSSRQQSVP